MKKMICWLLLVCGYLLTMLLGFLGGMLSETLIGSAHPMAGKLADVIVWFGGLVALSPAVCMGTAHFLRERPVVRRIVLAVPFMLLAVLLVLGGVADAL